MQYDSHLRTFPQRIPEQILDRLAVATVHRMRKRNQIRELLFETRESGGSVVFAAVIHHNVPGNPPAGLWRDTREDFLDSLRGVISRHQDKDAVNMPH